MSIHQADPFVEWIIATLEAADIVVGDGTAPTNPPLGSGYAVVYPIAGGSTTGSLDAPRSDATVPVQITSTSTHPQQTRWLADKIRTALNAAIPATLPDGRHIIWLDFPEATFTVTRDDDNQPPRWYAPDRYEFGTAP